MITYLFAQAGSIIREALAPGILVPEVTVNCTCYIVCLNGTVHHIGRDRVCDCGGNSKRPCPALPIVHAYLAAGGARPAGRAPDTWPETWTAVPARCPVCDCPTTPDPYLNSRAGPGWRCSLTGYEHFWMVRMNPLRRNLAANPPQPRFPWYDTPQKSAAPGWKPIAIHRAWRRLHRRQQLPHPPGWSPIPSCMPSPSPYHARTLQCNTQSPTPRFIS